MKVKALVLTLWAAGMGAGLMGNAHAADADRIQALEKQLQLLQKEIADIKANTPTKKDVADLNDQVVLQGKESVVLGDMPNSFRMPGSETSVHIYGYAEVDVIKDMGSSVGGDYFTNLALQPLSRGPSGGAQPSGLTQMTAQVSRFGIETTTPTAVGAFNTKIEADFLGTAGAPGSDVNGLTNNNGLLRLRHAYGEYAGFTIGQTWTTFQDGDNLPETADFNGPPGTSAGPRPVQVRYTYNVPDVATFKVAVEKNGFGSTPLNPAREQSPSLVLRADKGFSNGAAMSVRLIQHTENVGTASATGYGFGLSGSYKFTDTLTGFGQISQADSDNAGALIMGANAPQLDATGNVKMDRSRGLVLGLNNIFNPQWRTTLAYGRTESQFDAADAYGLLAGGAANKRLEQWHLNVYYTPIKNVDLGAELIGGTRTTYDGSAGDLSRVHLQARYTFN